MLKILTVLIFVFLLDACSTMPSGPGVLALPGTDKNFNVFHNDDLACRQFVHTQISTLQEEPDSKEEAQQNYDIGYIQCMYGKGHRVPVPEELMYSAQQGWYPPPPPNMPAPTQTGPSMKPSK
ncbi:hypothetical protein [Methylobacter sp.]|uniref:hypothetical protein n=1 Tax=Methylobacter sp. TaxID=2051955 RepID=UPI0011F8C7CB|nr:hypothetical protein [Methylobacter sp.]TAK60266.1 MAG: glycine zipper family protein [Methylobacter sp.]